MSPPATAGFFSPSYAGARMHARVVALGTAPAAGAPMETHASIRVAVAQGVLGDRYADDNGYFHGHPDMDVTLVEAEDAEAMGLDPMSTRRNIVTRDVRLEDLIGRSFRVGGATLHGMRRCLPCNYLSTMLHQPELKAKLRGGLRARVVRAGEIRVGDRVEETPVVLDDDMRAVVESARLCFVATVTPDSKPNLSPKGTIRVLDDRRLFFLDLASPQTRKNLAASPWMEINVVDATSRRGYRFFGKASAHKDDDVHRAAVERITRDDATTYDDNGAVVLEVDRVLPLVSPGYVEDMDEWKMREAWKAKRSRLDARFEAHVGARGAFRRG